MSVYKCPVCQGTGLVPNGFYSNPGMPTYSSTSTSPETCKSCNGTGIVYDFDGLNKNNQISP